jgi:hypothetical protein
VGASKPGAEPSATYCSVFELRVACACSLEGSVIAPATDKTVLARLSCILSLVVMGEVHGDSTFAGSTWSPIGGAIHK